MSNDAPQAGGAQRSHQGFSHFAALAADVLWRRRFLLMLPILVALPLVLLFVKLGPRPYVSQALLLLQENARENPLVRETMPTFVNMQDRVNGLQALLRSDRVLEAALLDIHGKEVLDSPKKLEEKKREYAKNLNLYPLGNDFLMLELRDTAPTGLGKRLEVVLSRFLEALLPADDARNILQQMHQLRAAASTATGASTAGIAPTVLKAPERIKLIDAPRDPVLPATPALKIVLAALALSIVAAASLVVLAEMLDAKVRHQSQFEQITGLAVLARLPSSGDGVDPAATAAAGRLAGSQARLLARLLLLFILLSINPSALSAPFDMHRSFGESWRGPAAASGDLAGLE